MGNPHFTMLGLGDIVIPGLLLCFVLRYDRKKQQQEENVNPPIFAHRIPYFYCVLTGYFLGKN